MIKEIEIKPFSAKRSNKRWSWTKVAKDYHAKMNTLRLLLSPDKDKIASALLSWDYKIIFQFKTPKSWSKKKTAEKIGTPHLSTPDIDNLFKALTDTIFYKYDYNDSWIWKLNDIKKIRGKRDLIIIHY